MRPVRKLRRAQTLTPFGVGAVFDIMGESFVAEDITRWKGHAQVIKADRITRRLGITQIRTAPAAPQSRKPEELMAAEGVPFYRFPRWMFCGACRRMTRHKVTDEAWSQAPVCRFCGTRRPLTPMRFVMICSRGHLDDVDWVYWAHSGGSDRNQRQCASINLSFKVVPGVGGGLQSLKVQCDTCKAERNLRGIAATATPKSLGMRCRGKQPWQFDSERVPCDADPVIVQRGASNVQFPNVRSALDIPPESDHTAGGAEEMCVRNHPYFHILEENPDDPLRRSFITGIAAACDVEEDFVEGVLAGVLGSAATPAGGDSDHDIMVDEWHAFTVPRDRIPDPRDNFVIERGQAPSEAADVPEGVAALLRPVSTLIRATRLREIRILTGFTRYKQEAEVPVDLGKKLTWRPGIEVFGEGVFFALDEPGVAAWEARPEVLARSRLLAKRLAGSYFARWLPDAHPRYLLLHTLSHLLIRQLTYETGYSGASLRERVYCDPAAGIAAALIYTGAGDSEGTLGGLVRQGEPRRFAALLANALSQATWCSLDPVCMESSGQGTDALSLAACHGCALVSETSCTGANVLLDRRLVIDPDLGFFRDVGALITTWAAM